MSLLLQVKLLLNLNINYIIIGAQYKILKLLFLSLLIYYLYYCLYKNTNHDICHHIFMYDGRDKNTNSQTNSLTKYILNTYGDVMQNKIYCNLIMINIYFRVCVRIFIRWKKAWDR